MLLKKFPLDAKLYFEICMCDKCIRMEIIVLKIKQDHLICSLSKCDFMFPWGLARLPFTLFLFCFPRAPSDIL